jgi:hypothetical protein
MGTSTGTNQGGVTYNPKQNNFGSGTVFKITPDGQVTTLYNFCSKPNCADGQSPSGGLVLATTGNFYGTTLSGGLSNPLYTAASTNLLNGSRLVITKDGSD